MLNNYEYLFRKNDDLLEFGVERAGHGGGFWFVATATEKEGVCLSGSIKYIGNELANGANHKKTSTFADVLSIIVVIFSSIILLPVILLAYLVVGFNKLYKAVRCKQKILFTRKQKLNYLMVNILGCEQVLE